MTNASFSDQESIIITDTRQLIDNYRGTGRPFDQNMCGVESERAYMRGIHLMSPDQSQTILKTLADQANGQIVYECDGQDSADNRPGAIVKTVTTDDAVYSLELSATFETATHAYPLTDMGRMLASLERAETVLAETALRLGNLEPAESATPRYALLRDFANQKVPRQRLIAELDSFTEQYNIAGLRTMLMATSSQVSLSYPDEAMGDRQFLYGNYLAPLYYAAFSNNTGFIDRVRTSIETPRAQWWLDHNMAAPRAGTPSFVYDDQCDMASAWVNYVQNVPMVYYLDQGKPVFGREKSFADLQIENRDLGNMANFNLAQSLIWTDVRYCNAGETKRLEFRAADSGDWQPYGLTALTVGLLGTPAALDQTQSLLTDAGLFKNESRNRDIVKTARRDVATKGLATRFGDISLGEFLGEALTIVNTNPLVSTDDTLIKRGLDRLGEIAATGENDTNKRVAALSWHL